VQLATVTFTLVGPDIGPAEDEQVADRRREEDSAKFRFNGLLDYTAKLIEKELPKGYRVEARAE
jgi:hypothetical protein